MLLCFCFYLARYISWPHTLPQAIRSCILRRFWIIHIRWARQLKFSLYKPPVKCWCTSSTLYTLLYPPISLFVRGFLCWPFFILQRFSLTSLYAVFDFFANLFISLRFWKVSCFPKQRTTFLQVTKIQSNCGAPISMCVTMPSATFEAPFFLSTLDYYTLIAVQIV